MDQVVAQALKAYRTISEGQEQIEREVGNSLSVLEQTAPDEAFTLPTAKVSRNGGSYKRIG